MRPLAAAPGAGLDRAGNSVRLPELIRIWKWRPPAWNPLPGDPDPVLAGPEPLAAPHFVRDALVRLAPDVAGVPGPDNAVIGGEKLGLGRVAAQAADGRVAVEWVEARIATWVNPEDLQPLDPHLRLIRICRRNRQGTATLLAQRLAPLEHHWTVEILPEKDMRTVREDGESWTFRVNTAIGEIIPPWPEPPTDDAAEAVAVADQAMHGLRL